MDLLMVRAGFAREVAHRLKPMLPKPSRDASKYLMRLSRITVLTAFSCALLGAATTVEPPKLRLGDNFRPRHYAVELTLEPGKDTFSGVVDIDIDVLQP